MDSEDKSLADVRDGNPTAPIKTDDPKAPAESGAKAVEDETTTNDRSETKKKSGKEKRSKKYSKRKSKKSKKTASPAESSSSSDSDDDDDDDDGGTSSSSSDDGQSEKEAPKKTRVTKKRQEPQKAKKKARTKKHNKASSRVTESESDSDSDSLDSDGSDSSDDDESQQTQANLAQQLQQLLLLQQQQQGSSYGYPSNNVPPPIYDTGLRRSPPRPRRGGPRAAGRSALNLGGIDPSLLLDANQSKDKKKRQKASKLDYKRVDQVWDDTIHNYKLQDTAEGKVDAQYEEFIFHVRRTFDWEGKYKATVVDIKSKLLRECLQDVIGDIKGISLVDDTPKLDPNMLFL
jgi:hypothetical protein